jgi:hypothetical protein
MKKLLLLLLLLPGCITWDAVMSNPEKYPWKGMIYMEWDGDYPIQIWRATIKLNEPFTGIKGYEYVLRKYEDDPNDEWYILEVDTEKNVYWEN